VLNGETHAGNLAGSSTHIAIKSVQLDRPIINDTASVLAIDNSPCTSRFCLDDVKKPSAAGATVAMYVCDVCPEIAV
jgi:hypothetical protein